MVGRWVEQIFLAVLQMGLAGTFCIAAVFAARLFLKKSPRIFSYALWGVAFFRLACPAPFESPVSLYGLAGDGFAEVRQGLAEDFLAQDMEAGQAEENAGMRGLQSQSAAGDQAQGAGQGIGKTGTGILQAGSVLGDQAQGAGQGIWKAGTGILQAGSAAGDQAQADSVSGNQMQAQAALSSGAGSADPEKSLPGGGVGAVAKGFFAKALPWFSAIWLAGFCAMLLYVLASMALMKRRLGMARLREWGYGDGKARVYYEAEGLGTPLVFGLFSPKVYLPAGLSDEEIPYILEHEFTHVRRRDYLVKLAAFLAVCVHWANPLVWAAFRAMGRDMEMSCDEAVLRKMGGKIKKGYSMSLLRIASGRQFFGNLTAFGENPVKRRVKNILGYKKPGVLGCVFASALAVAFGAALLSDPMPASDAAEGREAFSQEAESSLGKIDSVSGQPSDGKKAESKQEKLSDAKTASQQEKPSDEKKTVSEPDQKESDAGISQEAEVQEFLEGYFLDLASAMRTDSEKDFTHEEFASVRGYSVGKWFMQERYYYDTAYHGITDAKVEVDLDSVSEEKSLLDAKGHVRVRVKYLEEEYLKKDHSWGISYEVALSKENDGYKVIDMDVVMPEVEETQAQALGMEAFDREKSLVEALESPNGKSEEDFQKIDAYYEEWKQIVYKDSRNDDVESVEPIDANGEEIGGTAEGETSQEAEVQKFLEGYFSDLASATRTDSKKEFTHEDFASVRGYAVGKWFVHERYDYDIMYHGITDTTVEVDLNSLSEEKGLLEAKGHVRIRLKYRDMDYLDKDDIKPDSFWGISYEVALSKENDGYKVIDMDVVMPEVEEAQAHALGMEAFDTEKSLVEALESPNGKSEEDFQKIDAYYEEWKQIVDEWKQFVDESNQKDKEIEFVEPID